MYQDSRSISVREYQDCSLNRLMSFLMTSSNYGLRMKRKYMVKSRTKSQPENWYLTCINCWSLYLIALKSSRFINRRLVNIIVLWGRMILCFHNFNFVSEKNITKMAFVFFLSFLRFTCFRLHFQNNICIFNRKCQLLSFVSPCESKTRAPLRRKEWGIEVGKETEDSPSQHPWR